MTSHSAITWRARLNSAESSSAEDSSSKLLVSRRSVVQVGRDVDGGETVWFANVMLMPFHKIIASNPCGAHVWVPMDDEHTMLYSVDFQPHRPLQDDEMERTKNWFGIHSEKLPGSDRPLQNRDNDYLIDRQLQSSGQSFTGMKGLGVQDCAIQETMGPIADRTLEHLGVSDTAIIKIRSLLLQTLNDMAAGAELPGIDPASYRVRSTRFRLSTGEPFEGAVERHVALDTEAAFAD